MTEKRIRQNITICIFLFAVVMLPILLLVSFGDNTALLIRSVKYEVSDYFIDADGNPVDPGSLPNGEADYYLHHSIPEDMALCLQSKSVDFSVYSGDTEIYRYYPTVPKLYGRGYGKMYHYITVPGDAELRIHTNSANKDGKSYLKEIYFAKPADYMAEQLLYNMPNFLICFSIFVLGLVLVAGGIAMRPDQMAKYLETDQKHRLQILSMGVFALAASAWSGSETQILQIILQNPSGVHLISYFSLMIVPIPTVLFVGAVTDKLDWILVKVVVYGSLINFVVVLISVLCGGPDYHDLLITTHIMIGLAILCDLILILQGMIRKSLSQKTVAVISVSFLVVLFSAVLEVLRYRLVSNSTDTSSLFRIGMGLFVVLLSIYEVRELMNYSRYKEEAYLMERLAHTDALTKLRNRTAYNECMVKLENSDAGTGVIVYLDINDLKQVNDYYGHDEGDKHIKAAADIIYRAFVDNNEIHNANYKADLCTCYRIGGDEFAVLIGETDTKDVEDHILYMNRLCREYNKTDEHPIPLQIAAGMCAYSCKDKNVRDAQRKADDAMYENKAKMKKGQ